VLHDLIGGPEARAIVNRHVRALGLTIRVDDDADTIPDWEIQDFYEKTHPGEV
jgi:hypothetical protein